MPTTAVKLPAALEKFVESQVREGTYRSGVAAEKRPLLPQSLIKSVAASNSPGYSRKSRRDSTPDQPVNSIAAPAFLQACGGVRQQSHLPRGQADEPGVGRNGQ
jgi:hypothetical protein